MKLSEAIRAGAKLRPKAMGSYFAFVRDEETRTYKTLGSCALGAACDGAGFSNPAEVPTEPTVEDFMLSRWPELFRGEDGGVKLKSELFHRIVQQNDEAEMSREAIADLLEKEGL